jgi:tetratricopeptide (TPR) repeat protein
MKTRTLKGWIWTGIAVTLLGGAVAARAQEKAAAATPAGDATADAQALQMLRKGTALVEDRQEERGIKLIAAVPLNFPKSPVRFKAALFLGKYHADKNDFQLAIKNLQPVVDAPVEEAGADRAEALYRMGACYFGLADYNRALSTLRRVTDEYPWSVFANEAYYYIGLCHFRLSRWRNAIEALKLVGTSVPPNAKSQTLAESGQRFFVKISDKDLRVLRNIGATLDVTVKSESGDQETVGTEIFDLEGETRLGSIKMELGAPKPNDGKLQVKGGDVVTVDYEDANAQDGTLKVQRLATSRVVSTAIVGFMDGAYREYVHGVFDGQNTFLRVKDFDADVTDQKDTVKVRVWSQYRPDPADAGATEETAEQPEYVLRDEVTLTLAESEPHSGLFSAVLVVSQPKEGQAPNKTDAKLEAVDKDQVLIEYQDAEHIGGLTDPRKVVAKAEFLTGQIQDVWIAHREVSTEDLRARKNLIEARFYLKLAQIFKDVGLLSRAQDKAEVGLEKVEDILRRSVKVSLEQEVVEGAYQVKWDLLLTKGDLNGAMQACRTLLALYPQSSLADLAMIQIAKAKVDAKRPEEALRVLQGVMGLKSSPDVKAEAQYLIGTILEQRVNAKLPKDERLRAMGQAIEAYKTCADQFPESAFAGQSLGKVIDFYIDAKDYERSLEMLQTVFQDFPDASFLDEMLLKWGIVLAQQKRCSRS